jgi:tripartite-type tricarboxylate transporter receptor subunit TctC
MKLPHRRQFLHLATSAAALPASALVAAPLAHAQSVADFYRGKTVNMVVGLGVGGETDLMARSVAKYLGRHIPGNPLIVVQNMAGAGGMRAANYLYAFAPQDGTSIGNVVNGTVAAEAVGLPGIQFNAAKFHWMGSIAPVIGTVAVWHAAGIKTIEDARRREVVIAANGRGSPTYTVPAMMNEYFGTKFKIVNGYASGNDQRLALERGEASGYYTTWTSLKSTAPLWVKERKIIIIAKEGPPTTASTCHRWRNLQRLRTSGKLSN